MRNTLKTFAYKVYYYLHNVCSKISHNWFMFKIWFQYRYQELKFIIDRSCSKQKKLETLKLSHILYVDLLFAFSENKFDIASKLKLSTEEGFVLSDILALCQNSMEAVITKKLTSKIGSYYAVGHMFSNPRSPCNEYIITKVLYPTDRKQKIKSSINGRKWTSKKAFELSFMMFRSKPSTENIQELFNPSSNPTLKVHFYEKDDTIRYSSRTVDGGEELVKNCTLKFIGMLETDTEGKLFIYGCNERIDTRFSINNLEKINSQCATI